MSKFLMHLFAAFAEMERGIIRERVQAGVRAAKAKGTRLGRPQRVFRRDEAPQTAGRGEELEKCRANAKPADVYRHRRLPVLFGKPSQDLAPGTAQTQPLSYQAFTVRQTCVFRTLRITRRRDLRAQAQIWLQIALPFPLDEV